jgi:phosphohistidine phosphatase SixA
MPMPIGALLSDVALTFLKEDGSTKVEARSDASGRYQVELSPGRWTVLAGHPNYEDYHSAPGFFVVKPQRVGVGNVFLRNPRMTTVLVVRHAEKALDSTEPTVPLSEAGQARAALLGKLLERSGLTAVYSTDTVRTRATVQPAADRYQVPIEIYSSASTLAARVLADHAGDVALVAAHSSTVAGVLNAFGANVADTDIGDYDNLFRPWAPRPSRFFIP